MGRRAFHSTISRREGASEDTGQTRARECVYFLSPKCTISDNGVAGGAVLLLFENLSRRKRDSTNDAMGFPEGRGREGLWDLGRRGWGGGFLV